MSKEPSKKDLQADLEEAAERVVDLEDRLNRAEIALRMARAERDALLSMLLDCSG